MRLLHRRFCLRGATTVLSLAATLFAVCPVVADETAPVVLPKLNEQLQELSAGFAKQAPEAMRRAFAQGIADVEATGILDRAQTVGDRAADAMLTTPDGTPVAFSSLWAEKPVVVSFYRGGWCPYCNLQLRALDASLTELGEAGATLVAITPELPEKARQTAQKNELSLRVLTDRGNELARKMGIVFRLPDVILPIYKQRVGLAEYNGDDRYELPLAATYVIDTEGVIRYAFLDADYKKRAEPADILEAVRQLD